MNKNKERALLYRPIFWSILHLPVPYFFIEICFCGCEYFGIVYG